MTTIEDPATHEGSDDDGAAVADGLGYRPFDADNHYYEALDAFSRHLDPALATRVFQWAQIDRVFVPPVEPTTGEPSKAIRLDLWDGSQTWLPDVAKALELGIMLERVALARAIPIEGGTGVIDDLGNPLGE